MHDESPISSEWLGLVKSKTIVSLLRYDLEMDMRGVQKWKADNPGSVRRLSAVSELNTTNFINDYRTKWQSIKGNDESMFIFHYN